MDKCRVLMLCDSPSGCTGFSKVAYHIIKSLLATDKYHITVIGINDDGSLVSKLPVRVIPATSAINQHYNDLYGRKRVYDELAKGDYDIFWCLQDPGVIATFMPNVVKLQDKLEKENKFLTMLYTPVDSYLHTHKDWVLKGISQFNYPTTYTQYAMDEILAIDASLKNRLQYVYHGVDTNEFYPLPKEQVAHFRKNGTSIDEKILDLSDKFIVLNVNRNQIRKDYTKTFAAFKQFKEKVPNAFLLVLAQIQDQGGDLRDIASFFGLTYGVDWMAPGNYTASVGYPVEMVNLIYNIADVVFSSTVGEGFGLSSVEAMAVGKPCVFPNNTSLTEIFGEGDRGYLIPSGEDLDHFISYGGLDSSLVRPTIDTAEAANLLYLVYSDREEANKKVQNAREWVLAHTWESVNKYWIDRFEHVYKELLRKRA